MGLKDCRFTRPTILPRALGRALPGLVGAALCLGAYPAAGCGDKDGKKTTPEARRTRPAARDSGARPVDRPQPRRSRARESDSGPVVVTTNRPRPRTPARRRGVVVTPPTRPRRLALPPKPRAPKLMPIPTIKKLIVAKQYQRAIAEAKKHLEVNEKSVPAMAIMAEAYFSKGDFELCRAVLSSINLLRKDHPLYLYLWGHLYLRERRYALAQKYFERAVAKNPKLLDAWTMIGVRYLQGGSYQKALTALLKAKALTGGNTYQMNLNIGSCYRGLALRKKTASYYVTALNYYREAEKLFKREPGNANKAYLNAIYNKAILFLDATGYPGLTKVQRLEKGLGFLKQYVTLAPRYAPGSWAREKKRVTALLNKIKNADLPAAKAMARAAAAQPRPVVRRAPPRPVERRRRVAPGPPPR